MRILVIGCGSIGTRHIKNLKTLGVKEVLAYDTDGTRAQKMAEYEAVPVPKITGVEADVFIICTPPGSHLYYATIALNRELDIFIEKPIGTNLRVIQRFVDKLGNQPIDPVVYVGYNLRFHPALVMVKSLIGQGLIGDILSVRSEFGQYLPDWHPGEDYRDLYVGKRDCGIIMDASHEIHYLRWFFGEISEVFCCLGARSSLQVAMADTAEMLFRFESGVMGSLHLDFVHRGYCRRCKVIGDSGVIVWDWDTGVFIDSPLKTGPVAISVTDTYLEEMRHFLWCIEGKEEPVVTAHDGMKVVEVALAAQESAKTGKVVKI